MAHTRIAAVAPGMVVGALLLICCAKGVWATAGLEVPPDPDTLRDLGFVQGFLDGNWLGDPSIAGAWRWYPPLLHALAALIIGGLHLPLFWTWLHAGALLNLLSPLTFYLMNRRLIGAWPAAAATFVLVLFDSVVMPNEIAAGYAPWTLTPALAWPLFFGSIWLIAGRLARLRVADALVIGAALGMVFLAHTIPAVLLSGIAGAAALAVHGLRWHTVQWLVVVALTELAFGAPFLLPLLFAYHLHVANPEPGAWVHPALADPATLFPNLAGLLALGMLLCRRKSEALPRLTAAILGAWICLCLSFLGRHYVCEISGSSGGVCGVFVVAPHHYHVYLEAAWATLSGLAIARAWRVGRLRLWLPLLTPSICLGLLGFFNKPEDVELRRLGSTHTELILDRAAYDWILAHTERGDLFVTELPPGSIDMGPWAATVIAAGRRVLAPPESHANPYLSWNPRNERRQAALKAVGSPDGDLCPLLQEAGKGTAFALLARMQQVNPVLVPIFRDAFNTIYRVTPVACPAVASYSGKSGENLLQRLELVSGGG